MALTLRLLHVNQLMPANQANNKGTVTHLCRRTNIKHTAQYDCQKTKIDHLKWPLKAHPNNSLKNNLGNYKK